MACKEGQFDVVELLVNDIKTFSINFNAQHVNGMTPFDLAVCTVIRYSRLDRCPKLEMPHVKCRIRLKRFNIDSDQK